MNDHNSYTPTKLFYSLISVVIIGLIGLNFFFFYQTVTLKNQLKATDTVSENVQKSEKEPRKERTEDGVSDSDVLVTDFVDTLFSYTNDTYLTRFDSLSTFATPDVIKGIKKGYLLEVPDSPVTSEVTSLDLFHSNTDSTNTVEILAVVKSSYKIEDVVVPLEQIFKATVHQSEKKCEIVGFEVVNNSAGGNNIK